MVGTGPGPQGLIALTPLKRITDAKYSGLHGKLVAAAPSLDPAMAALNPGRHISVRGSRQWSPSAVLFGLFHAVLTLPPTP